MRNKLKLIGLLMCALMILQISPMPKVEANVDELSDTYWTINRTPLALQFDSNRGVTLLRTNSRGRSEAIGYGRYRVRGNTVTFTFEGESRNATISGRNRNIMTGRIYVDNQLYTIRATRVD